ncbi:hypothetical protein Trydic_g13945 [Trypoxylus dichotomus]
MRANRTDLGMTEECMCEGPSIRDSTLVTWSLKHNTDPKHTARTVKQWLEEKQIRVLEWSAQSPDLNLMENLRRDGDAVIMVYY